MPWRVSTADDPTWERQLPRSTRTVRTPATTPTPRAGKGGGQGVRALEPDDLPAVVELHRLVFSHGSAGAGLEDFLRNVLFEHPWIDEAQPSLAYTDAAGRLVGCLGVMPRPMTFRGEPIRVLSANNFIVHPEHRSGFAAIRLLRALLGRECDLILSEANAPARKVNEALGGRVIAARSQRWIRVLRPAGLAVHLAARRTLPARPARVLSMMAAVPDSLAGALPGIRTRPGAREREEVLDGALLAALMDGLTGAYLLRPRYSARSAAWLLESLGRTRRRQFLRARAVRARDRLVGWYVYYARPDAVGRVLQLGADEGFRSLVLRHLFTDARREGNVALSGSCDPRWADDLVINHCVFREGASWLVGFSSDETLLDALDSPDAFVGRLEGEGWLRFAA